MKKAKEGAADAKDPLPAIGTFISLGQKRRRKQRAEELIKLEETLLAEVLDAPAQGAQAGAPGRKERSVHNKYIYL
jgi:hypothetical protein